MPSAPPERGGIALWTLDRDHVGMTSASLVGRPALALGLFGLVGTLLTAGSARAEVSVLHATQTDNGVVLTCEFATDCMDAGDCDGMECAMVNTGLSICIEPARELRFEVFCCETMEDCPRRDEAPARSCSHVVGDISVCLWGGTIPRAYNLCTAANAEATFEGVAACFGSTANGALTLAQGDCDGDGQSNGTDSTVCVPNIMPPVDLGVTPSDLGMDDGSVEADGGTLEDSGSAVDHGTGTPPVTAFQGGGGCSAGRPAGTSSWGLLLVGALLLRRRRGGSR